MPIATSKNDAPLDHDTCPPNAQTQPSRLAKQHFWFRHWSWWAQIWYEWELPCIPNVSRDWRMCQQMDNGQQQTKTNNNKAGPSILVASIFSWSSYFIQSLTRYASYAKVKSSIEVPNNRFALELEFSKHFMVMISRHSMHCIWSFSRHFSSVLEIFSLSSLPGN